MIALIDIDGTIADCSHRLHYIGAAKGDKRAYIPEGDTKADWNAFYEACTEDTVIPGMHDFVEVLSNHYDIIYITSRPESHRFHTEEWLQDNDFPMIFRPYMRPIGDKRHDYVVKRELLDLVLRDLGVPLSQVKLAIEDRDQVVEMWRGLGILTLQPCKGTY